MNIDNDNPGAGANTPDTDTEEQIQAIYAMTDDELQVELDRQEALLRRQQNIDRLLYLRAGGTLTINEQAAEQACTTTLAAQHESSGSNKRNASPSTARFAKMVRPTPPDEWDSTDYARLDDFIEESELYFDALDQNLADDAVARTYIKTAVTWLVGDPRRAYVRTKDTITTWKGFIQFLKGCMKDPETRLYEATRHSQYIKQSRN